MHKNKDTKKLYEKITTLMIYFVILFGVTYGVFAENWYIKGGSTGLQNFSGVMNQDFYYQQYSNGANFTLYLNADCGVTSTQWKPNGAGACANPIIGNRTDFAPFSDTGYLWLHPTNGGEGAVLKFVAPFSGEFFYNASFYKYTGGNLVDFYIKKNGTSGILLFNNNLSGGATVTKLSSVNLTTNEDIVFYVLTHDTVGGDSSGIILNITANPAITDTLSLNVNSPLNQEYTNNNLSINVTYNISGTINKLWYNNKTHNITFINFTTIILNDGNYNFTFYGNTSTNTLAVPVTRNFTINTAFSNNIVTDYPECLEVFTINNNTNKSIYFNWTSANDTANYYIQFGNLLNSYITSNISNLFYNFTANPDTIETGSYLWNVTDSSGTYNSVCGFSVCSNNWVQTTTTCYNSSQMLLYTDTNNCPEHYNVPALNGTGVFCVATQEINVTLDMTQLLLIIIYFALVVFFVVLGLKIPPFMILGAIILAIFSFILRNLLNDNLLFVLLLVCASIIMIIGIIFSFKGDD